MRALFGNLRQFKQYDMWIGACYIRREFFYLSLSTLPCRSLATLRLDKSICNLGMSQTCLNRPSRIVRFINFAGSEEFVGRYKVLFKRAEMDIINLQTFL